VTAGFRPESGRLRYTAGIATGIVRCGFDRWWRQRLWRVGKQLRGIVWHRLIRIDDRVRLRRWRAHATSELSERDVGHPGRDLLRVVGQSTGGHSDLADRKVRNRRGPGNGRTGPMPRSGSLLASLDQTVSDTRPEWL
jgi:hypothetical protein